jgi:hypothetical protein
MSGRPELARRRTDPLPTVHFSHIGQLLLWMLAHRDSRVADTKPISSPLLSRRGIFVTDILCGIESSTARNILFSNAIFSA